MFDESTGWALAYREDPQEQRVLRTTDGGTTWQDVTPPQQANDGILGLYATAYFASPEGAWITYSVGYWTHAPYPLLVWRTQDGGRTWAASDPSFRLSEDDFPRQMQFLNDLHGWLLVTQPGMSFHGAFVLVTDDGGVRWSSLGSPDDTSSNYMVDVGCTKSLMSFRDLSVGWIVGDCGSGLYFKRTSDGGVTWSPDPLPPPAGEPGSYQLSKPRFWPSAAEMELATLLMSVNGAGWLYRSIDGGESWDVLPLPRPYGVETFLDSSIGWFAGSEEDDYQHTGESSFYQTRDGGQSWSLLTQLPSVSQLECANEQSCWAIVGPRDAAAFLRTSDGGRSWTEIPAGPSRTPPTAPTSNVPWTPCFDAPASRIRPGLDAFISHSPSLANRLRTAPDLNESDVITSIEPGARVHVNYGPRCNNQMVWWNVTLLGGPQGWTAEGDGRSSWLISGTPTPTPGVTPSRTPFPTSAGPEVFDVDPHELILDPEEFPQAGLTLSGLTDRTNSEILSLRGEDAGRIYLEESGRVLGVTASYSPESPDSSLPSITSILLVLFKNQAGPAFLLSEKGGPCREDEGRFQLQDSDLGLGDVSVLCWSDSGQSWVRVGYRNVYFDVAALEPFTTSQDEWLIETAAAQLQKLLGFPMSGSVSISPGD